jgi:hypothetical protein
MQRILIEFTTKLIGQTNTYICTFLLVLNQINIYNLNFFYHSYLLLVPSVAYSPGTHWRMLSPSLEAHLQHVTSDVAAPAPAISSNTLRLLAVIQDLANAESGAGAHMLYKNPI